MRGARRRLRIPRGPDELTSEWLGTALRSGGVLTRAAVKGFRLEMLGEGEGFVGQIARIHLDLDRPEPGAPATLVAKFPTLVRKNRALAQTLGAYEREIRFYAELAPRVGIRTPRCYYSDMDPNPLSGREEALRGFLEQLPAWALQILMPCFLWLGARGRRRYVLLLEDLAPARLGDQVAGCGRPDAEVALRALARVHASFWGSPELERLPWIVRLDALTEYSRLLYRRFRPVFFAQFGARLPAATHALADWLDTHALAVIRCLAAPPWTLLHGDYRLDNLFFADEGDSPGVSAVDWQGVARGRGALETAYFLAGSLRVDVAARHERDLLRAYHAELVARGVQGYGFDACELDYELSKLILLYRTILGIDMLDLSHERGTRLLDTWLERMVRLVPGNPDALLRQARERG